MEGRARRRRHLGRGSLATVVAAGVFGITGAASTTPAGPSGAAAAAAPLTVVMVTSLTGPGAPEFGQSAAGFDARVALQNAEGGVHGHKIHGIVLDDQTSPTQVPIAVQDALAKGAIGIVSDSPLFYLAAKYPNQADVPVTGGFFDGPEWGTQPYTNMFASDYGSIDPKYPVNRATGVFLRARGGRVICAYGYGVSPSSTRSATAVVDSFVHAGGKEGVLDTSVSYGSVDMTAPALVARQRGCDTFYGGLGDSSNFALATALEQAGIRPKVIIFPTGYEPGVIGSPAWATLQGDVFDSEFHPFQVPDAGTKQMQAALEKYAGFTATQFPSFGQYESWLGADLMIKGLELAGPDPTHTGVVHALRNLKSYNGNGILPESINYSTIFGHDLPKQCLWRMEAEKAGFVPLTTQPTCGSDIPGSSTAPP